MGNENFDFNSTLNAFTAGTLSLISSRNQIKSALAGESVTQQAQAQAQAQAQSNGLVNLLLIGVVIYVVVQVAK